MNKVGILGTGSFVPERVLSNAFFETIVDTSDEWITTRTGIKERRQMEPEQTLTDMAIPAAEDALAMVYPLNQVLRSDLVMRFFSGIGQVRQDFRLSWQRPPSDKANYVIDLVPRQSQAELKRLTLTINPQTYLVENLEFSNALGEETRFAFSRTTLDVKVAPSFFTFTPPPGVQVVREAPGYR